MSLLANNNHHYCPKSKLACGHSHVSHYSPDTCGGLDLRQGDGHLATLSLKCAWFGLDQVRGSADGHLLLQTPGNVASACQHKRVVCVWLQLRYQLPLQVSLHFHALLVVQDLRAHKGIPRSYGLS